MRESHFLLIFENNDFVVINKQNNINFHCEEGELGVVVAAEKVLGIKLFSVHRLDKMTSGLLLLAKSAVIAGLLSRLFREREIEKYYIAISDKKPKKKQGLIKGGMEKSRRSMWKLTKNKGNLAITQFFSFAFENGKRLFVIKPHTGKTHQIRVALKSLGSPICGDPLYADKTEVANYDRGYLHAYQISFNLKGEVHNFTAPPSEGALFLDALIENKLKELSQLTNLNWPKLKVSG